MGRKAQPGEIQPKREGMSTDVLSETDKENLIICENVQEGKGGQKNEDESIQQECTLGKEDVQMPSHMEEEIEEKEREVYQVDLKDKNQKDERESDKEDKKSLEENSE